MDIDAIKKRYPVGCCIPINDEWTIRMANDIGELIAEVERLREDNASVAAWMDKCHELQAELDRVRDKKNHYVGVLNDENNILRTALATAEKELAELEKSRENARSINTRATITGCPRLFAITIVTAGKITKMPNRKSN